MSQLVPNSSSFWSELEIDFPTMYTNDWNVHDFKDVKGHHHDYQLDGLNGGVPTKTTSTLTPVIPTSWRNLEHTFLNYQPDAESHQNEAGFVPPLVQSSISAPTSSVSSSIDDNGGGNLFLNMVDTKSWQGGTTTTISDIPPLVHINSNTLSPTIPTHILSMSGSSSSSSSSSSYSSSRRNIGGRRPNKENGISPEEEERRKLRRERNKLAAARCRKRRLDHTNELLEETQELEAKRQKLQEDLQKYKMIKQELEYALESHQSCRLRDTDSPEDVKPFNTHPVLNEQNSEEKSINMNQNFKVFTSMGNFNTEERRPRPTSLQVTNSFMSKNKMGLTDVAGISITTPSNGLTLNFESLMESGSGLTPMTSSFIPSCSTQLRNSNVVDLSSPDSIPGKLVSL